MEIERESKLGDPVGRKPSKAFTAAGTTLLCSMVIIVWVLFIKYSIYDITLDYFRPKQLIRGEANISLKNGKYNSDLLIVSEPLLVPVYNHFVVVIYVIG